MLSRIPSTCGRISTLTFPSTAPKYSNVVMVESFSSVATGKGMPGSSSTSVLPHEKLKRHMVKIIKILALCVKALFFRIFIVFLKDNFDYGEYEPVKPD